MWFDFRQKPPTKSPILKIQIFQKETMSHGRNYSATQISCEIIYLQIQSIKTCRFDDFAFVIVLQTIVQVANKYYLVITKVYKDVQVVL